MHVHANPGNGKMQRVLQISLVVTSAYVLATLLYGLRAHSLALVSEAGHNASDALALLLSFVAVKLEARPANDTKTFGYRRAGVLAAFLNALTLILISVWITWLAIGRLLAPVTVQPRVMMVVAALGVVMNGVIAAMLSRQSHDVNIRGAFLHMLGDTLSTAAVIAGGAVILWTGVQWVDPVLSLLIAGIIAWSAWGIMRETLNILLEGAPRGIDLAQVRASIRGVEGVCEVHDLHVWSIGSNWHALASHISVGEQSMEQMEQIQEEIRRMLRDGFQITHTTLQMEREGCGATDHGCSGPPSEFAVHAHHGHSH